MYSTQISLNFKPEDSLEDSTKSVHLEKPEFRNLSPLLQQKVDALKHWHNLKQQRRGPPVEQKKFMDPNKAHEASRTKKWVTSAQQDYEESKAYYDEMNAEKTRLEAQLAKQLGSSFSITTAAGVNVRKRIFKLERLMKATAEELADFGGVSPKIFPLKRPPVKKVVTRSLPWRKRQVGSGVLSDSSEDVEIGQGLSPRDGRGKRVAFFSPLAKGVPRQYASPKPTSDLGKLGSIAKQLSDFKPDDATKFSK